MISIETQLSVFLDNRPGTLARMCQALAKESINLLALSVSDTVDHAIIRLIVDNPKKASRVLEGLRITVQERQVVLTEMSNKPGVLAKIAERLTEAGINIEYAYCTSPAAGESGTLVLRTNNIEETISLLG